MNEYKKELINVSIQLDEMLKLLDQVVTIYGPTLMTEELAMKIHQVKQKVSWSEPFDNNNNLDRSKENE